MSGTKRPSREQARERAARLRQEQQRVERRRRTTVRAVVVTLVLVLAGAVGVAVQASRDDAGKATSAAPAAAVAGGTAFAVGKADAPVTVTAYEDFLCPACRAFEQASGRTLQRFVDDGTVRLLYKPIAILDRASTTEYSTRSLNAAACVADSAGADAFVRYHQLLYAEQPAEGSAGLSDARLVALGRRAGASGAELETCVTDRSFEGWTAKVTEASSKAGVNGTPTVLVDGQRLDVPTPENLAAAVRDARQRR